MKILITLILFITVNFNERFTNLVHSTVSDKTSDEGDQFSLEDKVKKNLENSGFTLSDDFDSSNNLLEETEKQETLFPSQSVIGDTSFLDNIQVSSELSATAESVVFPSADIVVELQNRVKSQVHQDKANGSDQFFTSFETESENYVVHAEPKVQVQAIVEEVEKAEINKSDSIPKSSGEEPKKAAPQPEDMPSFSEWTQKQLAEAEKKKIDQNETSEKLTKTRGKFRNKNYASPDCGAKIVSSNPEALSSSAVLSSLKDEYMLNYCTNRIWFVVELCEAIQAKQLDLANFELFSSSPKHFSVSVSHRYPTRDWSNVGKFTAQDTRDVQTFNLHPHLFGKYVRVDLHSHYGKEQFCPISWVGIYGTSEYEVLAKEDERHLLPDEDDQYEEDLSVGLGRDSPKNLFSSATDAVLSIVKKATAPFMKSDKNETKSQDKEKSFDSKRSFCLTPRYITVCNNCSQSFYDEVFHILSCQQCCLENLLVSSFIKRTLINREMCTKFGLDFNGLRTGAPFPCNYLENPKREVNYLSAMLKNSFVAALCNVLAVLENKVVVNNTVEYERTLRNVSETAESCEVDPSKSELPLPVKGLSPCELDYTSQSSSFPTKTSLLTDIFKSSEQFSKKIEPTKTLTEDEAKMFSSSDLFSQSDSSEIFEEKSTNSLSGHYMTSTTVPTLGKERMEGDGATQSEQKISFIETASEIEKDEETVSKSSNTTSTDPTLESIMNDISAIEKAAESPSSFVAPSASNLPAESIFLRLANRIKNLEINMSLSSTYLEELSKRYRVQLELLSKTLNLTIQKMEVRSKAEEEKEKKQEKEINFLRMQLANLTRDMSFLLQEKNGWRPKATAISQHIFFISVEFFIVWSVFNYWKRSADRKDSIEKLEIPKKLAKKARRRNSLEGVKGHETPRRKMRRPSDEALEIALSRNGREDIFKIDKKKRRRKKDSKCSVHLIQIKRKKSEGASSGTGTEGPKPCLVSEETQVPEFIPSKEIEITNRFAPISSPKSASESINSVSKAFQNFSTPIFMKTALASRNSRLKLTTDKLSSQEQSVGVKLDQESMKKERKSSNGLRKYMKKFF